MPAEDSAENDREADEKCADRDLQRVLFMQVRYLGWRVICIATDECITLYNKQLIVKDFSYQSSQYKHAQHHPYNM